MEDNNRINRRSRPRPYDLRRKVLLKNFLREQMTHISETRIESTSQSSTGISEVATDSVELDLTVLNEDVSSSHSENIQSNSSLADNNNNNSDQLPVDSVGVSTEDQNPVSDAIASEDSRSEYSPVFKFTNFVKLKKEVKTPKIVFKAKEMRKQVKSSMKTRSFRSGIERVFYGRNKSSEASTTSNQTARSSPRSLFSIFKHRKEQRHMKDTNRTKKPPGNSPSDVPTKYSTINQAVQTDDSWVREEMVKVKQSNRRLKEENRLLSESLSYFMSGASMDPNVRQGSVSPQKHSNSTIFPDYYLPSHNDGWGSKFKGSCSKSINEQSERKILRSHYPTRSTSFHHRRDIASPNARQSGSLYVPQNDMNHSRVRKRNMFTNLPSNSSRGVQRRSSMPERILSENERSAPCRRSDSMRDSRRRPFYMLSSEAFY